ncbi:sulfotransferase [Wukongibacter sp. M2B1]|uniref:sulfotransferase n=1 Tax=Wukongibacter sp. M2B1 TaxID=3088895 RepID=UPI003D78B43E
MSINIKKLNKNFNYYISEADIYNELAIDKEKSKEPVVIGGVGGSGTRVVAEILKQMNYYIGDDLNNANDNLWFVILLNRAKWFLNNNQANREEVMKRFNVFERIMTGSFEPTHEKITEIMNWSKECRFFDIKSGLWGKERVNSIIKSQKVDYVKYIGWGWKDPATYLFIGHMKEYFKSYKYIHVIRHGLDMAYSKNILHLMWFGKLYGIETPKDSSRLRKSLLNFWIKANNEAINNAKKNLGENFLLINFDELCLKPCEEINKMLRFLGIDKNRVEIDRLYAIPKKPKDINRYQKHDLSVFDKGEIAAVRKLGFIID